jgi:hypothetical protein
MPILSACFIGILVVPMGILILGPFNDKGRMII